MASSSLPFYVAIGLLMIDSIIEMSLVSSMVGWLHRRAGGSWEIAYSDQTYSLHGKPLYMLANHGHTCNGAAGTCFVLIGMGGILILWMRSRPNLWKSRFVKILYHIWLVCTVLSVLLTLAAIIFAFVITHDHAGQTIDQSVASKLNNQPYPNQVPYPLDQWTPENWFDAVLALDLVYDSDRSLLKQKTAVMRGWRINTIPMFIIGLVVAVLAFQDALSRRKAPRGERETPDVKETGSV